MSNPYIGYILEKATIPIEEKIAKVVSGKVRHNCCHDNQCEGLCGVAMHEYRILWVKEWQDYARSN